jgi:hypothetical protein
MSGRRKSHRIQLSEPETISAKDGGTQPGRRSMIRHKLIHKDAAAVPLTVKPAPKKREPREISLPLPIKN